MKIDKATAAARIERLTDGEYLTLLSVCRTGGNANAVAEERCLSPNTISGHIKSIYNKLKVNNKVHAAMMVYAAGLYDSAIVTREDLHAPKASEPSA